MVVIALTMVVLGGFVSADRRGNLTAKSYYKTKKGSNLRAVDLINDPELSTSKTSGASLLSGTKIPIIFEIAKNNSQTAENNAIRYHKYTTKDGQQLTMQNLLGSVSTQADINDYLLNGRIEDARENRAAAIRMMESSYEEEIRQRYGMTAAERDAWVAYMYEQAEAVADMSEEEFNNQILSYNGNQTARDTEQLQEEQSDDGTADAGSGEARVAKGTGIASQAEQTGAAADDEGRERQAAAQEERQPASPVAEDTLKDKGAIAKQKGEGAVVEFTPEEKATQKAVDEMLGGILGKDYVVDAEEGQKNLDEYRESVRLMNGGKRKTTSETVKLNSPEGEKAYVTVVSDAESGAKVRKNGSSAKWIGGVV